MSIRAFVNNAWSASKMKQQMSLTPNSKRFITFVASELARQDVLLITMPDARELGCNGYFDGDEKKLIVTTNDKSEADFISLLAHEFGHFIQWSVDTPRWRDLNIGSEDSQYDACTLLFQWLDGVVELNDDQLQLYTTRTQLMEQEADKLARDLCIKHKLPVDIDRFVQQSNAYILFYTRMMDTRTWYGSGQAPYLNNNIVDTMPHRFVFEEEMKRGSRFMNIYEKEGL